MPDTQPPAISADQVSITPDGKVDVHLTADQVLAFVPPAIVDAAVAQAKAEALGHALLAATAPDPAPQETDLVDRYVNATVRELQDALDSAAIQYPKKATRKTLATLASQHGVVVP